MGRTRKKQCPHSVVYGERLQVYLRWAEARGWLRELADSLGFPSLSALFNALAWLAHTDRERLMAGLRPLLTPEERPPDQRMC